MNGKDIVNVLNFSAFRPEPDDPSATWKRRFPNTKSVLFGLGKETVTVHPITRRGQVTHGEPLKGFKSLKDSLQEVAPLIKEISDSGWCAISLHTRYVISLETNLSRRPGSEEIVKSNPRTVLGGRYEKGKKYALTHNPETNSSILLTTDEEQLTKTEKDFKEAGFRIGRLCCGTYVLLTHALNKINTVKGSENPQSAFIVIFCEGAVCALVQEKDKWLELRSRTDVYENDFGAALDLIAPFQSRISREMPVVLMADTLVPELAAAIGQIFEGHEVRDLSEPNLLWNLILQN